MSLIGVSEISWTSTCSPIVQIHDIHMVSLRQDVPALALGCQQSGEECPPGNLSVQQISNGCIKVDSASERCSQCYPAMVVFASVIKLPQ